MTFLGQTISDHRLFLKNYYAVLFYPLSIQNILLTSQRRDAKLFKYLTFYRALTLIFH